MGQDSDRSRVRSREGMETSMNMLDVILIERMFSTWIRIRAALFLSVLCFFPLLESLPRVSGWDTTCFVENITSRRLKLLWMRELAVRYEATPTLDINPNTDTDTNHYSIIRIQVVILPYTPSLEKMTFSCEWTCPKYLKPLLHRGVLLKIAFPPLSLTWESGKQSKVNYRWAWWN